MHADVRQEGAEVPARVGTRCSIVGAQGLSVVQDKKVGANWRKAVYVVATRHGQVVIINNHVTHGKTVKEHVAQLKLEYVSALERGPVIVVEDYHYDPRRSGAGTEVDEEVRLLVEEMQLQDMSYNGTTGPSHYPAHRGKHAVKERCNLCAPSVGPEGDGGVYGGA